MQQAKCVPLLGMAREPGVGLGGTLSSNLGEVPAIFCAAGGEGAVLVFGDGEQARCRIAQWRGQTFTDRIAQEHPATLLAPLGKARIAQDANVARDAWLALTEYLREFAHCQLHVSQQAHDAQPGKVRQGAQGGFDPHNS